MSLVRLAAIIDGLLLLAIGILTTLSPLRSDDRREISTALGAVGLVVLANVFLLWRIDFSQAPTEDAAILMRYAKHIGEGAGIVWNRGGPPIDGATDFLFLVLSGALVRFGLSVELSVRLLAFLCQFGIVILSYYFLRNAVSAPQWVALGSATFLAIGPGFYISAAYFGTSLAALLALATWCAAHSLFEEASPRSRSIVLFSTLALLTGLARPEGVILAGLVLGAVVIVRGFRYSIRCIIIFALIVLGCGSIYFLWRWSHFGYPLPNPFYVKSEGLLHSASLVESTTDLLEIGLPFMLPLLMGLGTKRGFRRLAAICVVLFGFTGAFVLISSEMNFGGRYIYPIIAIMVVSWFPIAREGFLALHIRKRIDDYPRLRLMTIPLVSAGFALALWMQGRFTAQIHNYPNGDFGIAMDLQKYKGEGYSIALTEAGLLPLYSEWTVLDAAGLNDPWIAHNSSLTQDYIDSYDPAVIMFHAYYSPTAPPVGEPKGWSVITETLREYAVNHNYALAAVFGASPYDTHYYFVDRACPDYRRIIADIKNTRFTYPTTGEPAAYIFIPE